MRDIQDCDGFFISCGKVDILVNFFLLLSLMQIAACIDVCMFLFCVCTRKPLTSHLNVIYVLDSLQYTGN